MDDVLGTAMTAAVHILGLQNTQQKANSGLGLPIEIVGATLLACALLTATVLLLTRFRRRHDPMFMRERYMREQMQKLCPHGWSARIVLYGKGAPLPDDVPPGDRNVCVEWAEYEKDAAGHTEVAVARRLWARTITGGLRGMIADRELDLELERIERKVIEDTTGGETGPPATGSHGTKDR
jgi:hypothetical protein